MDERGEEMEKEVKPYYEDDSQSLDEVDTVDLLEMKEGALNDLNESDKENELVKVEYKDDIVKRIIDDYKRSFKEYDKVLDELLEEK
jgi:hypothetical protein